MKAGGKVVDLLQIFEEEWLVELQQGLMVQHILRWYASGLHE
jgi:hypothetical protein